MHPELHETGVGGVPELAKVAANNRHVPPVLRGRLIETSVTGVFNVRKANIYYVDAGRKPHRSATQALLVGDQYAC